MGVMSPDERDAPLDQLTEAGGRPLDLLRVISGFIRPPPLPEPALRSGHDGVEESRSRSNGVFQAGVVGPGNVGLDPLEPLCQEVPPPPLGDLGHASRRFNGSVIGERPPQKVEVEAGVASGKLG